MLVDILIFGIYIISISRLIFYLYYKLAKVQITIKLLVRIIFEIYLIYVITF